VHIPERNGVLAVTGKVIDVLFPEFKTPHFGDIILRCIAGLGIGRAAHIERNIEPGATNFHVRVLQLVFNSINSTKLNDFGHFQSAVHYAGIIFA